MLVLVGAFMVLACVLGGFVLAHGQILALWQPYELLIIGGGAVGAFISANPAKVVKAALRDATGLLKGSKYSKQDYIDLLSMLYDLFSLMRKEGLLGIEEHIEDPQSSSLFSAYPRLLREHHLIEFTTDCLRLIVGGSMNPHELEQLLEVELETHHHEAIAPALAITKMADALPGFGIVAAVLGWRMRCPASASLRRCSVSSPPCRSWATIPRVSACTSPARWSVPSSASCFATASSARWAPPLKTACRKMAARSSA